jgi:NAD(P)-dependent dehydrogenase (short-subunit alcohol dehydrogenase family)
VVCADVDIVGAGATADAVVAEGGEAVGVPVDVADEPSTAAMAAAAFGSIDVLVNNAAVYAGLERAPFDEIRVEDWDRVMAVNLRGPWLCAKACAAGLRDGGGSIVNIASATVLSGSPLWAHYVASKGAVIALSRVMARGSVLHAIGDEGVPIRTVAEVLATRLDVPAVSVAPEEIGDYLGFLGGFWGFDGPASAQLTRDLLGWEPTGPGLIADLQEGHYFA